MGTKSGKPQGGGCWGLSTTRIGDGEGGWIVMLHWEDALWVPPDEVPPDPAALFEHLPRRLGRQSTLVSRMVSSSCDDSGMQLAAKSS